MFVTSFSTICTYTYVHVLASGTDPFLIAAHVPITNYVCSFPNAVIGTTIYGHGMPFDVQLYKDCQFLYLWNYLAVVAYIDTIRVLIMQCIACSNDTYPEQHCVV